MSIKRGDWIETFTGKSVYPLDPQPEDFCIEDIAHSLSMLCRFAGHCSSFYSVAQHSVYVSYILSPDLKVWGLLHDAAEAYVSDISGPLKKYMKIDGDDFKSVETRILKCMGEKFNLKWPDSWTMIKYVDNLMLRVEAKDLMTNSETWSNLKDIKPLDFVIEPLLPFKAKELFLNTWEEYVNTSSSCS